MRWGLDSPVLPGTTPAERLQAARAAGADFVQWAVSNADLDRSAEEPECLALEAGIPIESVYLSGLVRFSEIYTHPQSRAATLRRLDVALALASGLGARLVVLAVKEVVPADVAVPAYKVGMRPAVAKAAALGLTIALEPAAGWPAAEARELLRGLGDPQIRWVLPIRGESGPSSVADDLDGRWPEIVRLGLRMGEARAAVETLQRFVRVGWTGRVVVGRDTARSAAVAEPPSVHELRAALDDLRRRF